MRLILAAGALALLGLPAAAPAASPARPNRDLGSVTDDSIALAHRGRGAAGDDLTEGLPRPEQMRGANRAMHRMFDALMGLDVAPIANAVEPGRYGGHETLGDLQARHDPYFAERAHRNIDAMTGKSERIMGAMARATPALKRSLHELERSMDEALRDVDGPGGD